MSQPVIDEAQVDVICKMPYEARAHAREPYTDERWDRLKSLFPGSIRLLRAEALAMLDEDDLA